MRQLIFSIIPLFMFSIALTACSSGSTASNSPSAPFVASKTLTIAPLTNTNPEMPGLAVGFNNTTIYTRAEGSTGAWDITDEDNLQIASTNTLSRITDAGNAPTITDADGTIANLTASFGGVSITPDRTFFGFDADANYMAYVSWSSTQTATDLDNTTTTGTLTNISGMMITGIQATNDELTAVAGGKVDFIGNGKGVYGALANHVLTEYNTTFSVTANVDFTDDTIKLTTNTSCADCGSFDASTLNFTNLSLSFADGNVISSAVTANAGALAGTLDARFYGDEAQEFGGTFALINSEADATSYYYGAFGGKRGVITPPPTPFTASKTLTIAPLTNTNPEMLGLAVGFNNTTIYTRAEGSTGAWDITDEDNLQIASTNTLSRITDAGNAPTITHDGTIENLTASFGGVSITPDRTFFGFVDGNNNAINASYMAYINWSSTQTATDLDDSKTVGTLTNNDGMMITGIATTNAELTALADTANFTGNGKGVYGALANNVITQYNTTFSLTANVDFSARTVEFSTNNTICVGDGCSLPDGVDLDITASGLGFASDSNNDDDTTSVNVISSAITANAGALTGTLDARFYGDKAQEFGGTFALTDATADAEGYYYGAFGALEKEFHIFANTETFTTWADAANGHKFNGLSYNIFNDDSPTRTFEIRYDTNGDVKRIDEVRIATINADGSTPNTQKYDKNIYGHQIISGIRYLNDGSGSVLANNDTTAGSLRFINNNQNNNLSAAKWIAIIHNPDNNNPFNYHHQTFGITSDSYDKGGFSTGSFTNDIPATDTGTVSFTGRAYGYYRDESNGTKNYVTRATVNVNVDFDNLTADFSTSGTRIAQIKVGLQEAISNFGHNDNKTEQTDLNINSSTLTYDPLYKWFKGDISAEIGSGEAVMKFYGPNAEEVGGVFKVKNSDNTKRYAAGFGGIRSEE
ncbi:MAG: transferrin-binding protein-like solute binding protein [Alphaproteobacteria bacterium]|nr:transferrin-binding protein-like solute binding protein [Alphaproteobacteria bacterium]